MLSSKDAAAKLRLMYLEVNKCKFSKKLPDRRTLPV